MIEDDSPIIDLYPADFRIDLNGKKFAWQGVALLPFVDEIRLLKTLESVIILFNLVFKLGGLGVSNIDRWRTGKKYYRPE